MARPTRVLIADDHALIRRGLREILRDEPGLVVVGEAGGWAEILDAEARLSPDVILLDVSMPGGSFLSMLGELRARAPTVRILVVTAHAEVQYARRALRAGALGYVTKVQAAEEIATAVRRVSRGMRYLSPALAGALADDIARDGAPDPHEHLTDREFEVFRLLAAGHTVSEVARTLHRSVKTVSTHRSNILRKMQVRSNADLVQYARDHRLAE